jgi:3-hydroxybutyryl-CoA dehydrogenase
VELSVIGVVGAGAMGAGIAQIGLTAGLRVKLFDANPAALEKARGEILSRISRLVEKKALPAESVETCGARLVLAAALDELADAQVVIEAIIERLDAKQALFKALEAVVARDAVLATNTSSLSVAAIALGCAHRDRVCGLHFFNPVPLMRLVEVIAAPATSAATVEIATDLSRRIGKTPVKVKDGPGFLVNLAGRAYATEALHIVQEGVTDPATVDRIMREACGFRMGPFELMDLTGIDVNFQATSHIYQGYQHDTRLKTTSLHELMSNAGLYGRKTKRGFFDYSGEKSPAILADDPVAVPAVFAASVAEPAPGFDELRRACGLVEGSDTVLAAPCGEDAASVAARLAIDPARLVALDLVALDRRHVTLAAPLGGSASRLGRVASWLRGHGLTVEVVKDSPGFVAQRILAMVANLGCELAQTGIGTPEDIDLALKLAQNYPRGPLEWAEHLGPKTVHETLLAIQAITGSDRYRPSLWLRRRALLGRSIYERD